MRQKLQISSPYMPVSSAEIHNRELRPNPCRLSYKMLSAANKRHQENGKQLCKCISTSGKTFHKVWFTDSGSVTALYMKVREHTIP